MAADVWDFYNEFTELIGDGTIDLDADTFNLGLYLSTSNAATLTLSGRAAVTNQHASANGYTQPGSALDSPTWVRSGGTTTFDSADEVFTASGGSIVCRFAVIDDDTVASPVVDPLVCFSLLDNTPADVTATDTNTLTIAMHGSGIFTLAT
ncbi:hypothetical protein LCGC14_0401120 [marine sediment metagenome]|uniref:Uncharacterized protein n=1 Tax=marine sediment metagenome TaxID=412755 RepID=A0A0F9T2F9_9ZZZZ